MSGGYGRDERARRRRRVLVWTWLLTPALGGAMWLVGVDVLHALAVATVVPLTAAVRLATDGLVKAPSLPPGDQTGRSDGTRREVVRLSWALGGRDHRVGPAAVRRLRALATHRLSLHGVDLTGPTGQEDGRRLLGGGCYEALFVHLDRAVSVGVFQQCVDALEGLDGAGSVLPHLGTAWPSREGAS